MIYPIVIYGSQTLRNPSENIAPDYPDLAKLVEDMFLTLGEADGVGLAAAGTARGRAPSRLDPDALRRRKVRGTRRGVHRTARPRDPARIRPHRRKGLHRPAFAAAP